MCGRYAASRDAAALVEVLTDLGLVIGEVGEDARHVAPRFNTSPTDVSLVVAQQRDGQALRVSPLSWGLVPSWAKDRRGAARMINARVETVASKPAFKGLLAERRCLVPADAWYEWQARDVGPKQPFAVLPARDPLLMLAGLYTWWRDPAVPRTADADTAWFGSFTVLTAPAREDLTWLHDRMPMAVARDRWQDWLARGDGGDAASLLDAVRADLADADRTALRWHPVDRRVGSVAQDGPDLLAEITVDPVDDPSGRTASVAPDTE